MPELKPIAVNDIPPSDERDAHTIYLYGKRESEECVSGTDYRYALIPCPCGCGHFHVELADDIDRNPLHPKWIISHNDINGWISFLPSFKLPCGAHFHVKLSEYRHAQ